jgi:hypothetical protein
VEAWGRIPDDPNPLPVTASPLLGRRAEVASLCLAAAIGAWVKRGGAVVGESFLSGVKALSTPSAFAVSNSAPVEMLIFAAMGLACGALLLLLVFIYYCQLILYRRCYNVCSL